jgi:ATP-dependent DNA ligase
MSKHCYVIASGPSLLGFDFDALPEGVRIGANRSAWLAKCDLFCTVDRNLHRKEIERIATFGANAHIALEDAHTPIPNATYWKHMSTAPGLALSPMTLAGSNSGFASFNLAVQLGYTDIALLGFDMKWDGERSHFHEGYGQRFHVDRQLQAWSRAFDEAARQLHGTGIRVTNFVGPMGSRVKAFPTAPLSELL